MWQFREIKAIEEPVFNNTLEKFYNLVNNLGLIEPSVRHG